MKSNPDLNAIGSAAIQALQDVGFSLCQIRPILPKLIGTTTAGIAKTIGMSVPTVNRTMMGHFGHPLVIREIAKVMNIPVEILFPDMLHRMDPPNNEKL
jgi:hypothetical protein